MLKPPHCASPADEPAPENFEELLIAHQHRIYFFIRSMVFNPDDARDVLQDVNAIVVRKSEQFQPGTDFKSWTFAIARYQCLTYLQKRKKVQWVSFESDLLSILTEKGEERADDVDSWLGALTECRKELTKDSAQLLSLRYELNTPLESVAGQWKTTVGALKQKLFRIRHQLKNCILKRTQKSRAPESL